jgi:D-3-phosphoglycerate dehydrogenase
MKIAIIDDYQDAVRTLSCYPKLKGHKVTVFNDPQTDANLIAARLKGFEAVLLTQQRTRITKPMLEKMPDLKLISQTGPNAAHIDLKTSTERGVLVSAGGSGMPNATAELTWGLIIGALRQIPFEAAQLRQGHWQTTLGTGLHGKTLGIYAYGRIGSIVAGVGRAFGMNVVCFGRGASMEKARAAGFATAASRASFFAEADVVSIHLPLNAETRGIITAADLALMKRSALFVNTSRAPLVEASALAAALKKGHPGFAAVDVFEEEPVLESDHPLLKMKNVLCTPHLGYVVRDNYESYYGAAIDQIVAFAAGAPINVANPEVLKK